MTNPFLSVDLVFRSSTGIPITGTIRTVTNTIITAHPVTGTDSTAIKATATTAIKDTATANKDTTMANKDTTTASNLRLSSYKADLLERAAITALEREPR